MEQPATGLCAVETDGRAPRTTLPNLQYNSGRRGSQVGSSTITPFAPSAGGKRTMYAHGYTREYTQEEADRENEVYLLYYCS